LRAHATLRESRSVSDPTNKGPKNKGLAAAAAATAMARGAHAPLARNRRNLALFVAGIADLVQMVFFPAFVEGVASPFEIGLDVVTAIVILLIVGFQWRLAFALAIELVPAVDLFPTWTAVVLSLPVASKDAPALPPAPPPPPTI
jgi:hypothetical protein